MPGATNLRLEQSKKRQNDTFQDFNRQLYRSGTYAVTMNVVSRRRKLTHPESSSNPIVVICRRKTSVDDVAATATVVTASATTSDTVGMVVGVEVGMVVRVVVRVVVGVEDSATSGPPHGQHTLGLVLQGAVQVVKLVHPHLSGSCTLCCVRCVVAEAGRAANSAGALKVSHTLALVLPPSGHSLCLVLQAFLDLLSMVKMLRRALTNATAITGAAFAIQVRRSAAAGR